MAGTLTEEYAAYGSASSVGVMPEQVCQSAGDSLAEWRSSEQVENGTPSTSPAYSDTDDDEPGTRPSDLFGRFTWKIDNFSQINKRELRSNSFDVGGYKWYILIYPQGCDVCNHLSLFLCVANHDKLLPGWSHFAQFTIAVVNRDPKKSKYSDTLHRFWKKEHDWGWKKFMELTKLYDGFVADDVLIIKAQVQVIREKTDRPFRCLDCQYRRELVRVYLSNVEQICRRFIDERRNKLGKVIEDKVRWSSFRSFWLSMDPVSRQRMSRDKADSVLRGLVKLFFLEKEVTSTLVMDSLYSGLKTLEFQNKSKKTVGELVDVEEITPMVLVDQDMFSLADDVIGLLERAVVETLPHHPSTPKDDKNSQNRTKDGSSGEEFNKDYIERDDRRLTQLGRRTIEFFFLVHIFSKLEVAYQEAVALKRQEELIREEEEACLAENELKGKRVAAEKEKRAKKKQAKQKRNGRKGKDKAKPEKLDTVSKRSADDDREAEDSSCKQTDTMSSNVDNFEDASDVSDTADEVSEILQPDLDDRDSSAGNVEVDASAADRNVETNHCENSGANDSDVQDGGLSVKSRSHIIDNLICSSDAISSTLTNGSSDLSASPNKNVPCFPKTCKKGWNTEDSVKMSSTNDGIDLPPDASVGPDCAGAVSINSPSIDVETEGTFSSNDRLQGHQKQKMTEKDESAVRKLTVAEQVDTSPSKSKMKEHYPSPSPKPSEKKPSMFQHPKGSSDVTKFIPSAVLATATTSVAVPKTTASRPDAKDKEPQLSIDSKTEKIVPVRTEKANMHVHVERSNLTSQSGKLTLPVTQSEELILPGLKEKLQSSNASSPSLPPICSVSKPEVDDEPAAVTAVLVSQDSLMSRPSSAPQVPVIRKTSAAVPTVQVQSALARSMSATGRLGNEPSPNAPSYVPLAHSNAMMVNNRTLPLPRGFARHLVDKGASAFPSSSSVFSSSVSALPHQLPLSRNDLNMMNSEISFGSMKPDMLDHQQFWRDDSLNLEASSSSSGSIMRSRFSSHGASGSFDRFDALVKSRTKHLSADFTSGFSQFQSQGAVADEFPHLDIINDLLDEDHSTVETSMPLPSRFNPYGRQHSLPGNIGASSFTPLGSFPQVDHRTEQYYDSFSRTLGQLGAGNAMQVPREMSFPQFESASHSNGRLHDVLQIRSTYSQLPDHSMLNLGTSYDHGNYSDSTNRVNGGYPMYQHRPSKGR